MSSEGFGLKIIQPVHGYRFSLDPLLLCDFAAIQAGDEAVDLGAGCGIIPLVLSQMAVETRLVGVESQAEMAELAERNVALNGLTERVAIRHADILEARKLFPPSSFDLVVANPPYRKRGSGRISPKPGRDLARHESTASLRDFLASGKKPGQAFGTHLLYLSPDPPGGVPGRGTCPETLPDPAADGARKFHGRSPHVSD